LPTCDELFGGSIFANVTGGCSAFNYDWSGPNGFISTDRDITGLEAGDYTLNVSDQNDAGVTATRQFSLNLQGNVDFTATVTDATNDEGNNGAIDIEIPGGIDTLSFEWNDGSTDLSRDSLMAGNYSLTISDGTDCPTIYFAEIKSTVFSIDGIIVTPISCFDLTDASISGSVSGACDGLVIRVNGEEVNLPINDLGPGSYELTVDDNCGNMATRSIDITAYEALTFGEHDIVCSEADAATVTLATIGGSGNFDVQWSAGEVDPTDSRIVTGVPAGELTALVNDGCDQMEVTITVDCDGGGPPTTDCNGRPIITPNGDGLNDEFIISCLGPGVGQPNTLNVYDRWGNLVFNQDNYENTWAGTDNDGDTLPEGGYMWVLIQGASDNRTIHRGTVTILKSGN